MWNELCEQLRTMYNQNRNFVAREITKCSKVGENTFSRLIMSDVGKDKNCI